MHNLCQTKHITNNYTKTTGVHAEKKCMTPIFSYQNTHLKGNKLWQNKQSKAFIFPPKN